jgi:hypothetical protein
MVQNRLHFKESNEAHNEVRTPHLPLREALQNLEASLRDTGNIENAFHGLTCPMRMFIQLTRQGWSPPAVRMLAHDLKFKGIFLKKVSGEYFDNVGSSSASLAREAAKAVSAFVHGLLMRRF